MHRDPPHLRAGRQGRRGRRGAWRPSSRAPRSAIRARADTRMGPLVTRAPAGGRLRRHPAAGGRGRGRLRRRRGARARRHRSATSRRSWRRPCCKLKDAGAAQGGARGRSVRPGRHHRALSRRAGCMPRWSRAGGGSLVASVYGEDQDFLLRIVSAIGPGHGRILVVDPAIASRPYRPRHRHAAMQSRRPRPRRRRARSWAGFTACASITSAWRCRDRATCSRACRRRRRACIDAGTACRHRALERAGQMYVTSAASARRSEPSVLIGRTNGAQLRRAPRAVERRAVRGGGQRRSADRGARARGRAPVVSRPARHPARQDRDGERGRAR